MKRVFSLFLALMLVVVLLRVAGFAATKAAITIQPTNSVAPSGQTAEVSFTPTGDCLTYTWYF